MAKTILDGIWGSFAGLAIGDALGMPFHELTPDEIRVRCNGLATDFYKIFEDEFIHLDYQAGQVTVLQILKLDLFHGIVIVRKRCV